jgi:hypothetical protein
MGIAHSVVDSLGRNAASPEMRYKASLTSIVLSQPTYFCSIESDVEIEPNEFFIKVSRCLTAVAMGTTAQ